MRGDDTQEGLSIRNFCNDFSHIGEVMEFGRFIELVSAVSLSNVDFRTGDGIPNLNQRYKNSVATMITGCINFPHPGIYWYKIFTNNGVRLVIGGIMLYEGLEPYPNWASDAVLFTVCEAGLEAIVIAYNEREGSWAIEFSWRQSSGFNAVPASHFTH